MRTVGASAGIDWLDRDECLRLLAADEVGRLAVVGAPPAIFSVIYRLDGEAIVFRTDPGTELNHGSRAPACFELDTFDRDHRPGWSVLVTGRLEEATPTTPPRSSGYVACRSTRGRAVRRHAGWAWCPPASPACGSVAPRP